MDKEKILAQIRKYISEHLPEPYDSEKARVVEELIRNRYSNIPDFQIKVTCRPDEILVTTTIEGEKFIISAIPHPFQMFSHQFTTERLSSCK